MKRKGSVSATAAKRPRSALTPAQSAEVQRQVNRTLARSKDYKICTYERTSAAVDYNGTVYDLFTNMARGDNGRNNFEGQHVQIVNMHIRGQVACADVSNMLRIIVFQWYDDTAPTTTSILDNAGIIGTADAPYATRNWSNRPLYRILRDDMIQLQANATLTGGNGFVYPINYFIKSKKITKTFWAATAVSIQKGGIYLCVVSDSAAVTHPNIIFTSEIIFTDE